MTITLAVVLLPLVLSSQPPAATTVAGCWELSPALGPSSGARPADSAFRTLILHERGGVGLPRLADSEASMWERRSRWSVRGTELELQLFTGLQGWQVTLNRQSNDRWTGTARYLTDVIVRGARPIERAVLLQAIACEAAWRARPAVVPDPPLAQPYFNFQVDRSARLLSPPPSFMKTFRALGPDESIAAQPGRAAGVQFVVTTSGQVATWTVKFLGPRAGELEVRRDDVIRALGRLRFEPAQVQGKAVNVLEQYLLVW